MRAYFVVFLGICLLSCSVALGEDSNFREPTPEELDKLDNLTPLGVDGQEASEPDFVQGDASQVPPRPAATAPSSGMKLSVPKLTPEESNSRVLPEALRCEGCQAVVYQMVEKLKERESKQTSKERGKPLRESQYLDVFDALCKSDWSGYGVKDVDGVHHLSGPGLAAESHMSMMYGGAQWPNMLNGKCGEIVEELGEDDLYAAYWSMREKPSGVNPELFCKTILTDCKPKKKKQQEKKKKKAAASKKKPAEKKQQKKAQKDEL